MRIKAKKNLHFLLMLNRCECGVYSQSEYHISGVCYTNERTFGKWQINNDRLCGALKWSGWIYTRETRLASMHCAHLTHIFATCFSAISAGWRRQFFYSFSPLIWNGILHTAHDLLYIFLFALKMAKFGFSTKKSKSIVANCFFPGVSPQMAPNNRFFCPFAFAFFLVDLPTMHFNMHA